MKTEEEKFIEKTEIEFKVKKESANPFKALWKGTKLVFGFLSDFITTAMIVWLFIVVLPEFFMYVLDRSLLEQFRQHMRNHEYVFHSSLTITIIYYIFKVKQYIRENKK